MDQKQVQKLISELQNGTVRQRRAASYKLRNFKDTEVVQALIDAYIDSDSSVRHNAIEGLRLIGTKEAQEFLISQDQSSQVTKSVRKNTVWFFLIPLTTITLGVALGLAMQYRSFVSIVSSDYGGSPAQLISISGIVFGYGVVVYVFKPFGHNLMETLCLSDRIIYLSFVGTAGDVKPRFAL